MFEDTKITRRHNLKRDSQYTGQRDKNDQQNTTQKTKD